MLDMTLANSNAVSGPPPSEWGCHGYRQWPHLLATI